MLQFSWTLHFKCDNCWTVHCGSTYWASPIHTTFNNFSCISQDSLLDRALDSWSKVVSSNPSRSDGRMFFSRVNIVCLLLFGVCSTPVLPQWHVKKPCHSAKIAGGRLHVNTLIPLSQWSWSGLTMPLFKRSVGTYQETSIYATRQGTLS